MKLRKKLLKTPWVIRLIAFVASLYMRFVYLTTRWEMWGYENVTPFWQTQRPFIAVFWHNRLLLMPHSWRHKNPCYMLISGHSDGQLISRTVEHFDIRTIAGSTTHGGMRALKSLLTLLKEKKQIGITPDGPRGPRFVVSLGTAQVARLSQCPVIPFCGGVRARKIIPSWDRFIVPLPFTKGILSIGAPIYPPQEKDEAVLEQFRSAIEQAMLNQAKQVDEALGHRGFIQEKTGVNCS